MSALLSVLSGAVYLDRLATAHAANQAQRTVLANTLRIEALPCVEPIAGMAEPGVSVFIERSGGLRACTAQHMPSLKAGHSGALVQRCVFSPWHAHLEHLCVDHVQHAHLEHLQHMSWCCMACLAAALDCLAPSAHE